MESCIATKMTMMTLRPNTLYICRSCISRLNRVTRWVCSYGGRSPRSTVLGGRRDDAQSCGG